MNAKEKTTLMHWGQYGIRAYLWLQTFILILWCVFSIVPGMANLLDTTENGFHSVTHIGFWLAYEILLITVGGTVISLNSKPAIMKNATLLYIVTLLIGIGANIVHVVASSMELYRCTSVLCINTPAVLLTLIVLYVALAIIETMCVYMANQYRVVVSLNAKKK